MFIYKLYILTWSTTAVIETSAHEEKLWLCSLHRMASSILATAGGWILVCTSQYAVEAQTSLAPLSWFHGSRVTTARAHQCCIFQSYCEDCAVANEIDYEVDYAWASIHDNGHMITACDVWL